MEYGYERLVGAERGGLGARIERVVDFELGEVGDRFG